MALPGLPIIPPINPAPAAKKAGDALVPDEKMRASELIRRESGWRGNDARIALGVMGAESGFNANALNNTPCSAKGDHAVGLMQVCTVNRGAHGIPSDYNAAVAWLKDPANNVRAAYGVWQSQGWGAWTTYTSGAWKNNVGQDPIITVQKKSLQGQVGGAINDAAGAVINPIESVVGALTNPSTWLRLGKGYLGGVFIIIGTGALVFIVADKAAKSPAGNTAVKTAVKVAKVVK